jgi:hypothetical protein
MTATLPRRAALAAALLLPASLAAAQVPRLPTPWASPRARTTQVIGISEVTVDYGRPGVKGRAIWGGLVPWDSVWRAGANENTTITLSHDARIEGQPLAAGTYGLHLLPRADRVTVIFSRNSASWGSFTYDEAEDALRVDVTPVEAPFTEWLEFGFTDLSSTAATCRLAWDTRAVPFRIAFDTPAIVVANARDSYLRGVAFFSWQGWDNAARYCLNAGVQLEQGLQWAERSVALNANATNLVTQAGLLEKLGRVTEAALLRERAAAMATEADLNAQGYQHLNAGRLPEALAVLERVTQRWPESWNAWDSLAEACAVAGDRPRASELYRKARALAPADQHARIDGELRKLGG